MDSTFINLETILTAALLLVTIYEIVISEIFSSLKKLTFYGKSIEVYLFWNFLKYYFKTIFCDIKNTYNYVIYINIMLKNIQN